MEEKPGFGFRPYDDELVGFYLRHKILGNNSLVQGTISEVNVCSFDPWDLRFQSKIKSRDPLWYFFSRRENKYANGNRQSRTTRSGFWKLTGESVDVKDHLGRWCGLRGKIGHKRVLVFVRGKNSSSSDKPKSDWVMHELHYTLLPEDKRTYVICRLEYKGDDVNILSANATDPTPTSVPNMVNSADSVVDQSYHWNSGYYNTFPEYESAYQGQQFGGNFDMQQSAPYEDIWKQVVEENYDSLVDERTCMQVDMFQGTSGYFNPVSEYGLANQCHRFSGNLNLQEQHVPYSAPYEDDRKQLIEENCDSLVDERTCVQEDFSHYRPKNPVTGVFACDSSDDDTDSTIGRDTWSSTDSVGSKDGPYHTPKDDIPSLSIVEPLHNHEAQEQPKQLELQLQGKEKVIIKQKSECELKTAEDSIKKAPSTTAAKQSWIVIEEMSQRNSRWIYLKNTIIGFLLFLSIIGWIILVG